MPKATTRAKAQVSGQKKQQHESRNFYWSGYHSTRWRKTRKAYLAKHPECVECAKENRSMPAVVLDHIIPIEDGSDPWDSSNWQVLCMHHDASKRGQTKRRPGRG